MINCFVEMVACGVKNLALSPPLLPEDYQQIAPLSEKLVKNFAIHSHLEKSLINTDLQPASFTDGKWSILYFKKKSVLDKYLKLKKKSEKPEISPEARTLISIDFMRLLSYPERIIQKKISSRIKKSPFMIIE